MKTKRDIRAVCADIDGTLLDKNRALSPRTVSAIRSIKDKVPVILASSRMPGAMRHLQEELGIEDYPLICFNGGYVILYENGSTVPLVLDSVKIPLSACDAVLKVTRATEAHVSLFLENDWYAASHDQWTAREERITKVSPTILSMDRVMDQWRSANTGAHKIMCMGAETEVAAIHDALLQQAHLPLHLYRSKTTYLEIAPGSISKASALRMVMEKKGYGNISQAMAFGDNYNDIELIRDAGLGIAVGNAIQEVKDVATEITLNAKEDGVAVALEAYFS